MTGDTDAFMVIPSTPQHHQIIDKHGIILGYRYPIPDVLVTALANSTFKLPCSKINAGIQGQYSTHHYAIWREYQPEPHLSNDYKKDLPASANWCKSNAELFKYLSNALRMISPQKYARYLGARKYLEKVKLEPLHGIEINLKPLCGIWYGAAINQFVTGDTIPHQDWKDHGYNCVVPWGEYQGGRLVLQQLKIEMELQPGDAFFFMGSLITHNVKGVRGVRNSIDLFCHHTVLAWKDKCDEKRRGKRLKPRQEKKLKLRWDRKLKSG